MSRLFLFDGTALAYRSHFALAQQGLTAPDGRPTGATYGFAMTLRRILEGEEPDLVAVALDPPGKTFRHERYADYKATRQKAPDEMKAQLDDVRRVVRAHGIPIFEVPGFEADDVIGTLAVAAKDAGHEVMIVTGDKDFMQLVGPSVKLYNVFKPNVDLLIEDEEAVQAKFGTSPDGVIDVLAIMGDSSDNVPGVKGIGEKGAAKLIAKFGSVAGLLERLDEVKGKQKEYIERDRDALLLSRELVTIDIAVPLDPGLEGVGAPEPDRDELQALFEELGFTTLLKRVLETTATNEERDYRLVTDAAGLESMLGELRAAGKFAFDTETTSLFPLQAELVGMSFSIRSGQAWYVPLNANPPVLAAGRAAVFARIGELLTDTSLERIGQNSKYDWLVLAGHGLRLPPPSFDTMVASYCVHGPLGRHGLDELALKYFGIKKIPTKELIGTGQKQITMDEVDVERVSDYACEDADVTWRLFEVLSKELADESMEGLFHDLEMPLVPVLAAMEERGIRLDVDLLNAMGKELEGEIETAAAAAYEAVGREFKLQSHKELGQILFEELRIQDEAGVKRPKRTRTGWATDAETLQDKYADVPIVKALLTFRELNKLNSTYVQPLPGYVNPKTGRVHCSFSQTTAATGRLASSDPNLQNIPVRTERGQRLRQAFVPQPPDEHGDWVLLAADYSQVELRIMAHLAGDELMVKTFEEGRDVHTQTAATVFSVHPELVTREMRSKAKAVNFGLLYGMGATRLARETGLSSKDAKKFIERYFEAFPRVRAWKEAVLDHVRETGVVETLLGRRRPIPDINSTSPRARVFAENTAVNTPVQGSAADIIKKAMVELEQRLTDSELAGRLLLQVHDELLLEVPASEVEATIPLVRDCMENTVVLDVPLKVDFGWGANWLEAH